LLVVFLPLAANPFFTVDSGDEQKPEPERKGEVRKLTVIASAHPSTPSHLDSTCSSSQSVSFRTRTFHLSNDDNQFSSPPLDKRWKIIDDRPSTRWNLHAIRITRPEGGEEVVDRSHRRVSRMMRIVINDPASGIHLHARFDFPPFLCHFFMRTQKDSLVPP
jgi:hypothetical protein